MTKPRLAIDTTFLWDQYSTRGIGRYGKEIVGRMLEKHYLQVRREKDRNDHSEPGWQPILVGYESLEATIKELVAEDVVTNDIEFINLGKAQTSTPVGNIKEYYLRTRRLLKAANPDLYFAVHFERPIPSDIVPTVAVVHDIIPMVNGKYSSKSTPHNILKGLYYTKVMWPRVQEARQILAPSDLTINDLINKGGIDPRKIAKVYLGVSPAFSFPSLTKNKERKQSVASQFGLWDLERQELKQFCLYDAGFEKNKNSDKLARIFANLVIHHPQLKLVVTGGDFEPGNLGGLKPRNERGAEFSKLAKQLGIENNIVPVGKVRDSELITLLASAICYFNFSGYEGFGLGPLQAMEVGTPAIISNLGCFPEISGPGAMMVDPNDIPAASREILSTLESPERLQDLIKKGAVHSKRFTWDKTFFQTWEIISPLLFKS